MLLSHQKPPRVVFEVTHTYLSTVFIKHSYLTTTHKSYLKFENTRDRQKYTVHTNKYKFYFYKIVKYLLKAYYLLFKYVKLRKKVMIIIQT